MSELILSRRDINFLLFEWLQVDGLNARPRFAAHDRFAYEATLDVYEALARDLFAPHNKKNDSVEPHFDGERVIVNPEVGVALRGFADAGLVATGLPASSGGMDLPSVVERAGMAFLLAANIGTASYEVLTIANANLLLAHATRKQIGQYVPAMVAGLCFGTMCLSEPQAGSSLADIRTRAMPDRDGSYRLFGNKMWISGGEHDIAENIVHLVLAKIPDERGQLPAGVQGISLFTVPRRLVGDDGALAGHNDIALAGINHKMGYRGTVNCLLNFGEGRHRPDGSPGAVGEIVGEPGQGLAYMFHMMNEARISVGLGAAALAYTGYLHALEYARTRCQGRPRGARGAAAPVPIVQHPDVRRMLLAQKSYASGALALCLYAARLSDDVHSLDDARQRHEAELLLDLLTPVVKSWPSHKRSGNPGARRLRVFPRIQCGAVLSRQPPKRDSRRDVWHSGTRSTRPQDAPGKRGRDDFARYAHGDHDCLGCEIEQTCPTCGRISGTVAPDRRHYAVPQCPRRPRSSSRECRGLS